MLASFVIDGDYLRPSNSAQPLLYSAAPACRDQQVRDVCFKRIQYCIICQVTIVAAGGYVLRLAPARRDKKVTTVTTYHGNSFRLVASGTPATERKDYV